MGEHTQTFRRKSPLRLLLVEDSPDDAALLIRHLERSGHEVAARRVEINTALRAALEEGPWDIVISDYAMPSIGAMAALKTVRQFDPDLPFVIVSDNIGEDAAVAAMRAGAQDYLLKANLARLAPVVDREVSEAAQRRRRRAAEDALAASQARLNSILASQEDIVWSVGLPDFNLEYLNMAAERICRRPLAELSASLGHWLDVIHPDDRHRMREYLDNALSAGSNGDEFRIVRPDGSTRWLRDRAQVIRDEQGMPIRIDGIATDITEQKGQRELLYRIAHHDPLTGLPNRVLMRDRLGQALARAERNGQPFAVLFLDLDNFKRINDGLGHGIGDGVLCEVAARIGLALRAEDSVGRLGGDEFVILLQHVTSESSVAGVARKILEAVIPPITVEGFTVHCTASLGAALCPRDGADAEEILKNADTAMYRAKQAGRNTFRCYAAEMNATAIQKLELEDALRKALDKGQFELAFQPLVDLHKEGRVCALEVLLRWRHPDRGLLAPAEFMPLAEETGIILPLGYWILREACGRMRICGERLQLDIRVSVNITARQFADADLAEKVGAILAETGFPAGSLQLELTESLIMQDVECAVAVLGRIRKTGVSIAVGNFGKHPSSLACLRRFPIDEIKIDKSYVDNCHSNPDNAAICASIIAMAHSLHLRVVAEGVEHEAQLGFLVRKGCDGAQGRLFSPPVDAESVPAVLNKNGQRPEFAALEPDPPSRTILLVDDEEHILSAVRRVLRREGCRILTARDATEAFELLARHRIGVVMSDQRMPGMPGAEFLRHVKTLYPDTMRIILTGYTDFGSVLDAINGGAVYRFFTKPWDDDALRDVVRRAFREHEMREAEIAALPG